MSVNEKNKLLSLRFNDFDSSEFKIIASALTLLDKQVCSTSIDSKIICDLIEQMSFSLASKITEDKRNNTPLNDFPELTVRALNCLRFVDVLTVSQLLEYPRYELHKICNLGKATRANIFEFIEKGNY